MRQPAGLPRDGHRHRQADHGRAARRAAPPPRRRLCGRALLGGRLRVPRARGGRRHRATRPPAGGGGRDGPLPARSAARALRGPVARRGAARPARGAGRPPRGRAAPPPALARRSRGREPDRLAGPRPCRQGPGGVLPHRPADHRGAARRSRAAGGLPRSRDRPRSRARGAAGGRRDADALDARTRARGRGPGPPRRRRAAPTRGRCSRSATARRSPSFAARWPTPRPGTRS